MTDLSLDPMCEQSGLEMFTFNCCTLDVCTNYGSVFTIQTYRHQSSHWTFGKKVYFPKFPLNRKKTHIPLDLRPPPFVQIPTSRSHKCSVKPIPSPASHPLANLKWAVQELKASEVLASFGSHCYRSLSVTRCCTCSLALNIHWKPTKRSGMFVGICMQAHDY